MLLSARDTELKILQPDKSVNVIETPIEEVADLFELKSI